MEKRIIVTLLLLLMLTLPGCGTGQESGQAGNRPTVTVVEAKTEQLCMKKAYDAVLELDEEQYICTRISGYVRHFYRNEGEEVQPGDKIVLLENQTVTLAQERSDQELHIAQIQYEKLQARAEEAKKEMERKQLLYQEGAVSRVELDKSELEWQLLNHDREQAQKQLQLAAIKQEESSLNAGNCEVTASDNLWLAEKMVKTGQFITAGQPIFRAGKWNSLLMNIKVPGDEAGQWQEGDKLEVECHGKIREAIIKSISKVARPGTGRVVVEVRVKNPELDWLPGTMAQVKYSREMGEHILIPVEAIAQGETPYVYIVKDKRVHRQKVTLGTVEGCRVCVSGLQKGSLVVTGGLHRLRDGETVNIKDGL
jgi:multidrug efflux system membrane fusion protein